MFLANYSDGLTDVDLDDMIETIQEERQDRLLPRRPAVRSPIISADIDADGTGRASSALRIARRSGSMADTSCSAREIFDYMREGEELVLEPFQRLIEADQLMAYKHEGFWRADGHAEGSADSRGHGGAEARCPGGSPTAHRGPEGSVDGRLMRALELARPRKRSCRSCASERMPTT